MAEHLTVGRLRAALIGVPDDTKVLVHAGWDFGLLDGEDGPQVDDEGLVLYLDYAATATMVNKDWYKAQAQPDVYRRSEANQRAHPSLPT